MVDDAGSDPSSAAVLPTRDGITGQWVSVATLGSLETPADSDWFSAELGAGLSCAITITPDPSLASVQLVILDAAGAVISKPWIAGTETAEPFQFTPPADGTYILAVSAPEALAGKAIGGYFLQVTPLAADGMPLQEPMPADPLFNDPLVNDPLIAPGDLPLDSGEPMTIQLMTLADGPGRSGGRPPLPWERTVVATPSAGASSSGSDHETAAEAPIGPGRACMSGRKGGRRGQGKRRNLEGPLPAQAWAFGNSRANDWGSSQDPPNPWWKESGWIRSGHLSDACAGSAPWSVEINRLF